MKYLFALFLLSGANAASTATKGCRDLGFEMTNLACSTCELFTDANQMSNCRACCQSFRDISMIRKPYEGAVLAIPSGKQSVSEEVKIFLEEDFQRLVEAKGNNRLTLVETSSGSSHNFFFAIAPVYLHFFDDQKKMSGDLRDAQESISLHGWKREDIREMLQALLP